MRIVCERAHEKGMLLYLTLLVQVGSDERRRGKGDVGALLRLPIREQAS